MLSMKVTETEKTEKGIFEMPANLKIWESKKIKLDQVTKEFNLNTPKRKKITELTSSDDLQNNLMFPLHSNISKREVENETEKKSEVNGAVLEIEEYFVICNIYLDDTQQRKMRIRLAKSIFPDEIHYGSPIILSYNQDENGFKRVQIKLAKINMTPEMKKENKEIDNMVDSF